MEGTNLGKAIFHLFSYITTEESENLHRTKAVLCCGLLGST